MLSPQQQCASVNITQRAVLLACLCHFCTDPGKVWKPKEEEKVQINEDEKVETEWDEVLAQATEEELVDLAGIILVSCTPVLVIIG